MLGNIRFIEHRTEFPIKLPTAYLVILVVFLSTYAEQVYGQDNSGEQDTIEENKLYTQVAIGVMSTSASIFSGWRIVKGWQERKDRSDIRKTILCDFQTSFKDYIILMDTFVATIVNGYSKPNGDPSSDKRRLSKNLPFGYEYSSLPAEHPAYDFAGNIIVEFPNSTDLDQLPTRKYTNEFASFERQFYAKRIAVTKFLSGLRQYYVNSDILNKELDLMWEKIMANHVLVSYMMKAQNETDFFYLLDRYNLSATALFEKIKLYDKQLSKEKIIIE